MRSDTSLTMTELYNILSNKINRDNIIINADMKKYTSFKAGGEAALLVTTETIDELMKTMEIVKQSGIKYFFLGNGSNILVKDSGYDGVIIKLGESLSNVEVDCEYLTANAGARISAVAKVALEHGLTGLEFANGIPGSIGGAVFMNAGAYGCEIEDVIESVQVISGDGRRKYCLKKEELKFSYRNSIFHEIEDVVISARFKLQRGNKEKISLKMEELMEKRNERQPVNLPSAGSFFKRPDGYFAGKLIQDSGLKGLRVGGAQVSPLHAGFIVNTGEATATDILQLMKLVQNTVFDKFGVRLEPEICILGNEEA